MDFDGFYKIIAKPFEFHNGELFGNVSNNQRSNANHVPWSSLFLTNRFQPRCLIISLYNRRQTVPDASKFILFSAHVASIKVTVMQFVIEPTA
jgi:hypothetical protein